MPRLPLLSWLLLASAPAGLQRALPVSSARPLALPGGGDARTPENTHHVPYPASIALLEVLAGPDEPPRAGMGLEPSPLPVLYGLDAVRLIELGITAIWSDIERIRALRECLRLLELSRSDTGPERATVRLLILRVERLLSELDAVAHLTRVQGVPFLDGTTRVVELRPAPPARGAVRLQLANLTAAGLGLRGFDLADPLQAQAALDATLTAFDVLDGLMTRLYACWSELRQLVPHGLSAVETILLEMRELAREAQDETLVTSERGWLNLEFMVQREALYRTYEATHDQGLALLEGGTVRLDCADESSLGLRLPELSILSGVSIDALPMAARALMELDVELDAVRDARMRVDVARTRIVDGVPGHVRR